MIAECIYDERIRSAVPKFCSADPKGTSTSSQGIRGYFSVVASLKFTYFFKHSAFGKLLAPIKGVGSMEVMSTSVSTGLNPFNFIRKHFLQICL